MFILPLENYGFINTGIETGDGNSLKSSKSKQHRHGEEASETPSQPFRLWE